MVYTDSFKAKMVQRLSAPNAISAIKISKEVGVSQSQLAWVEIVNRATPAAVVYCPVSTVGRAEKETDPLLAPPTSAAAELGRWDRRMARLPARVDQLARRLDGSDRVRYAGLALLFAAFGRTEKRPPDAKSCRRAA